MDVYTLDALWRRENIIDNYESLIWTERFQSAGDFRLDIASTFKARNILRVGTNLAIRDSYRVMTIETIEDKVDSEGRKILTVSGRSIERILEDRVAKNSTADLTTSPKWVITDTPTEIARKVFHDICVTGVLDAADIIAGVVEDTFMPADTLVESIDEITVEFEPTSVYSIHTTLASTWGFGFRLLRQDGDPQLYYDVYVGSDRTTQQTDLPAVVFAPEFGNLQNTSELTTVAAAKNVAYVYSPAGFEKVYALDVDPAVEGFERRVLVVNATDITDDNPDVSAALIQRGQEELAKYRQFSAFDGEINPASDFQYGVMFNLGDLVEQRNDDGVTNVMRVTEQIFVSDKEGGDRSYPTLTMESFVTPGSWAATSPVIEWLDFDAEHWDELP